MTLISMLVMSRTTPQSRCGCVVTRRSNRTSAAYLRYREIPHRALCPRGWCVLRLLCDILDSPGCTESYCSAMNVVVLEVAIFCDKYYVYGVPYSVHMCMLSRDEHYMRGGPHQQRPDWATGGLTRITTPIPPMNPKCS